MPENLPALSEQIIHAILDAETIALCARGFEQTTDTKLAESYRHRAAEDAVALTARLGATQAEMEACERSLERAVRREGQAEPVECGGKSAATAHRLALEWAADIGLAVWVGMGRSDVGEELLKTPVNHEILPTLADYAESWAQIVPVVMRRAKGFNRERIIALVRSESVLLADGMVEAPDHRPDGIHGNEFWIDGQRVELTSSKEIEMAEALWAKAGTSGKVHFSEIVTVLWPNEIRDGEVKDRRKFDETLNRLNSHAAKANVAYKAIGRTGFYGMVKGPYLRSILDKSKIKPSTRARKR